MVSRIWNKVSEFEVSRNLGDPLTHLPHFIEERIQSQVSWGTFEAIQKRG